MPDDNMNYNKRRRVLKTLGSIAGVGLAGCTGSGGDGSGDSSGDGSGDSSGDSSGDGGDNTSTQSISKPWSTEELAKKAQEEGGTLSLYASLADKPDHQEVAKLIQEEYSFFSIEPFIAKGDQVSQRFKQEWQADSVKADSVVAASELRQGTESLEKYFESGVEDDYEVIEGGPDTLAGPYSVYPFNRGPLNILIYHEDEVNQTQLDLLNEMGHNAFLEPELEGMKVIQDATPQWKSFGFICGHFGEKRDMDPGEWLQAVDDNVEFVFSDGHSSGIRQMASGKAAIQFNGYSHHIPKFSDLPVGPILWDEAPLFQGNSAASVVNKANNPWTARFYLSAMMEPWLQKKLPETDAFWPGRPDLEYEGLSDYTKALIETELTFVPVDEIQKWADIGEEAYKAAWGDIPG